MKHMQIISKGPQRAQMNTSDILTIVASVLSAVVAVLSVVAPLVGGKK